MPRLQGYDPAGSPLRLGGLLAVRIRSPERAIGPVSAEEAKELHAMETAAAAS
jgi:hypothetical protein